MAEPRVSVRLVRLPGRREGTEVLFNETTGHCYHINGPNHGRCWMYTQCRCNGRITHDVDEMYFETGSHDNHQPNFRLVQEMELKNWCYDQARDTRTRLHDIYLESLLRFPHVRNVSYASVRRTMQRRRREVQPPNPTTLEEAYALLMEHDEFRMANDGEHEFFAERVTVPNGQTAFIFINDEALEDFVNATSVHSDATFKSPPRLFYQMGTLHAFVHGVRVAVGFFLMTGKTQDLYEACFGVVNNRCFARFGRIPTPRRAMADCEMALLLALATCYPTAEIRICGFHYSDAILKRAMTHGLGPSYRAGNPVVKKVVKMLMTLNLFDPDDVEESFEEIIAYAAREEERLNGQERVALANLFSYFRNFWIIRVGPAWFCVGGDANRTNNLVEAFHRVWNLSCGAAHINFWSILHQMALHSAESIANRNVAQRQGAPPRRREYINRDLQIQRDRLDFRLGRITRFEFMEHSMHYFDFYDAPILMREEILQPFALNNEDELNLPGDEARAAFHALLQVQPLPPVVENMRINRRRANDAPENDRRGLRGVRARGRGGYGGGRGRHGAPVDPVIPDDNIELDIAPLGQRHAVPLVVLPRRGPRRLNRPIVQINQVAGVELPLAIPVQPPEQVNNDGGHELLLLPPLLAVQPRPRGRPRIPLPPPAVQPRPRGRPRGAARVERERRAAIEALAAVDAPIAPPPVPAPVVNPPPPAAVYIPIGEEINVLNAEVMRLLQRVAQMRHEGLGPPNEGWRALALEAADVARGLAIGAREPPAAEDDDPFPLPPEEGMNGGDFEDEEEDAEAIEQQQAMRRQWNLGAQHRQQMGQQAAVVAVDALDLEQACGACQTVEAEATIVPCGHGICFACIVGIWDRFDNQATCPLCRAGFNSWEEILTDPTPEEEEDLHNRAVANNQEARRIWEENAPRRLEMAAEAIAAPINILLNPCTSCIYSEAIVDIHPCRHLMCMDCFFQLWDHTTQHGLCPCGSMFESFHFISGDEDRNMPGFIP